MGVFCGLSALLPMSAMAEGMAAARPEVVPRFSNQSLEADPDSLRGEWASQFRGPLLETPKGRSGRTEDRAARLVESAVEDFRRGEISRGLAALETALRLEPGYAEAHWVRSLVAERQGDLERAEEHLQKFLVTSEEGQAALRSLAERRLLTLGQEREHTHTTGTLEGSGTSDLAVPQVARDDLARAQSEAARWVGVVPSDAVEVVFYGEAAYREAHRARFSFDTAGFFDGRIHVKSSPQSGARLRSLLFHESMHAVFREQAGGDQPYWLNEGMAHRNERQSEQLPTTTRSERAALHDRIASDRWIPLADLVNGFGGLTNAEAKTAYLEAAAAVDWIEARTDRVQRAQMLRQLRRGDSTDEVLWQAVGVNTAGLESALRVEIESEFTP